MTVRKIGRRWMLLGAGGAAISLPALPSLLGGPFKAEAQDPAPPRRMVAIVSGHGGVAQTEMYPDDSVAGTPFSHPLHTCHRGALTSREEGGDRLVSDFLRAPTGVFTESIASKMNLLRGLDVPFYYGHARHNLGSYADMSNNHDNVSPDQETADQVMAYSPSVYESTPRRRMIYFGRNALSVELSDRGAGRAGGFRPAEEVPPEAVFDSIYVENPGEPERRPPIDAVYESYARLESGAFGAGARLGSADRARLTQYMDRLSDIRAGLNAAVGLYCGDVTRPDDIPNQWADYRASNAASFHDIVMAAFMCDSSRIAVFYMDSFGDAETDAEGGYHEVVHNSNNFNPGTTVPSRMYTMVRDRNRTYFRDGVLDLVGKLDDVAEGDGTMLDSSLVWWTQEAGSTTHNGDSIPIVTFGSAGGAMQTGQYLDMRDREDPFFEERFASRMDEMGPSDIGRKRGACYFQWTTTYLDAFGVDRSAWQVDGRRAFSAMPNEAQSGWEVQYDWNDMDSSCEDPLPILT